MDRDAFDWLTDDYMAKVRYQRENMNYHELKAWPRGDHEHLRTYPVDVYLKHDTAVNRN